MFRTTQIYLGVVQVFGIIKEVKSLLLTYCSPWGPHHFGEDYQPWVSGVDVFKKYIFAACSCSLQTSSSP